MKYNCVEMSREHHPQRSIVYIYEVHVHRYQIAYIYVRKLRIKYND